MKNNQCFILLCLSLLVLCILFLFIYSTFNVLFPGGETVNDFDDKTFKERIVLSPTPIMAIDTSKGRLIKGDVAYIDGRDSDAQPPLTVMNVRVWGGVPRTKVVCELRHGTEVDILDIIFYQPEERSYLLITKGDCQGWVSEPFLSDRKHRPIGDQL